MDVHGRGDIVLKEKIRLIKDRLRWWNLNIFGKIDLEVEEGVRVLNESDDREMWDAEVHLNKIKASRRIWLNLKERRSKNHIGALNTPGGMVCSVREVKEVVRGHFESKFKEECFDRPLMDDVFVNSLSLEDSISLEVPFSMEEIKEAVWSCDGSKSMRPDGIFLLFFKKCWSFVQEDVVSCFNAFYSGTVFSKSITSSFLTLVPKKDNPLDLDDYRLICLVGSIYKMISKLLASRIKRVFSSIISNSQSAFVPGRQMLDGVIVANEIVDYASKEGKECLLFKDGIWEVMDELDGVDRVFSKMPVLVNGSPTKEFVVEKGLRQGDPISPFLFVIVAEGLKALMGKAVENGDFVGFNMNGRCEIDILQFVDDTLLIGDGSWNHIWAIKSVLRGFEMVSGLRINFHKSKLIGININPNVLEIATTLISCRSEDKHFKFLGIMIGSNPRRISSWKPLLDNVRRKLNCWKGRWLSFGGRITLLKSVLSSMAIFTLSFYKAPKVVIAEINKLQSNFLWGGSEETRKTHWVCWKDLCLPVEKGGLGFRNLEEFNNALLLKWNWRIFGESNSLWYRVLKARYKDVKMRASFCNGCSTSFWNALRLKEGFLKDLFPRLYSISLFQEVSIGVAAVPAQHAAAENGPVGDTNRGAVAAGSARIYGLVVLHHHGQVEALARLLLSANICLGQQDKVTWNHEIDGKFSVSSCYYILNSRHISYGPANRFDSVFKDVWKVEIPLKESFWYWSNFCRSKKVKKGKEGIIWLAILWSIWLRRNDIVFNNASWNSRDVVWSCKALIWRWSFIGKIMRANCNFYEFSNNPLFYLS
ncbi:uncharacterized protein LOC131661401 [Vicia villosa]|uniref:uncharacterized protein LOC131661401 n=1 Tax=Vicia villosa TaxID=3911 RepID=UPI00273B7C33|nr:uncharacterized protein LOC131661401 [Vicia villosa]